MDEATVPALLARKLGYSYYGALWENIMEEEITPYLDSLPKGLADQSCLRSECRHPQRMA